MVHVLPVARAIRTAPPTSWPAALSLDALKQQVGIAASIEYHDAYLLALREAAVDLVEQATGRILAAGPFRWQPEESLTLLRLPVRPVDPSTLVVELRESQGQWSVVESSRYVLLEPQEAPTLVAPDGWPPHDARPGSLRLSFTAGDGSPPPRAVQAVLMLVGHWFAQRDPVQPTSAPLAVPAAVDLLVASLRQGAYP